MNKRNEIFESLSPEMKVRWLKGANDFYEVMEQFARTDSSYLAKERFVLDCAKRKMFTQYPPEQWGALTKSFYLQYTAITN